MQMVLDLSLNSYHVNPKFIIILAPIFFLLPIETHRKLKCKARTTMRMAKRSSTRQQQSMKTGTTICDLQFSS